MAMDLIKGSVHEKSGLIQTPKGRLIYPELFTASLMKGEKDQSRAAFRATLLFPKSANLDILVKAVNEVIHAEWGANSKDKIKKPFLKTEENVRLAELADKYPVFVRLSTRTAPVVVHANMSRCEDPAEVYGGRWATASVNPNSWRHDTGGKGVSLYMSHIMLLDHDEPLGSSRASVEDVFEAVEGAGDEGSASNIFD